MNGPCDNDNLSFGFMKDKKLSDSQDRPERQTQSCRGVLVSATLFREGVRTMLVLSRKINEEVIIDNHIRIRIVQVSGGKVRLGIDAPRDVSIQRAELTFQLEKDDAPMATLVAVGAPAVAVPVPSRIPR